MRIQKIGVFAPSMPSEGSREEKVKQGIEALERSGYEVELGESVWGTLGYKSAAAEIRARDLVRFLLDSSIDVILATTGGYNSNEILGHMDFSSLPPARPKVFVGYSDCTAISLALEAFGVCDTASGPMLVDVASDPTCFDRLFSFLSRGTQTLCNDEYVWEDSACGKTRIGALQVLPNRLPKDSGGALAGNLSTFCLMLGTRFFPSCTGRVLFLEYDKEETKALPSLERYLWQIRYNGIFSQIRGLVFGALQSSVMAEENAVDSIRRILAEVTEGFTFPVVFNAQFGHLYPSWIIPNGWRASLESASCEDGGAEVIVERDA